MNCKKTILISLFTIGILFLTNVSDIKAIDNLPITTKDCGFDLIGYDKPVCFKSIKLVDGNGKDANYFNVNKKDVYLSLHLKDDAAYCEKRVIVCTKWANPSVTINWGDGTTDTYYFGEGEKEFKNDNDKISHSYSTSGQKLITITAKDSIGQTSSKQFYLNVCKKNPPTLTVS
ncbi:MAG TPA: hypothetical protein PK121_00600, partial [Candidatus Pacearchaeota archaeon]|nr:hypothetical protein [Candidatus Pacearchaeota archaeon]